MSWRHVEAASKLELRSSVKFVLIAIAHHTNDYSGIAWPGLARLARWTGLDRRSVQRCVAELEAQGFMSVKRGTGTASSVYTLTLPGEQAIDITDGNPLPPEALGPGGGTESPPARGGDRESPGGRQRVTPGVAQSHPNKKEQEKNESDARAFDEDWLPSDRTLKRIQDEEGLSPEEIERERRLFVLKNLEHNPPRYPDAAFRTWCARLKTLNHQPKAPPKKASHPPQPQPGTIAHVKLMIERNEDLVNLYGRMGRNEEIRTELQPKLRRLREELRQLESEERIAAA